MQRTGKSESMTRTALKRKSMVQVKYLTIFFLVDEDYRDQQRGPSTDHRPKVVKWGSNDLMNQDSCSVEMR